MKRLLVTLPLIVTLLTSTITPPRSANAVTLISSSSSAPVEEGRESSSSPPQHQHFIKGQTPQIGNGYVATFIGSPSEYVAGVFYGRDTTSTRAALPSMVNFLPKCGDGNSRNGGGMMKLVPDEPFGVSGFPYQIDMQKAVASWSGACVPSSSSSSATPFHLNMTYLAHRKRRGITLVEFSSNTTTTTTSTTPLTDYFSLANGSSVGLVKISTTTTPVQEGTIDITVTLWQIEKSEKSFSPKVLVAVAYLPPQEAQRSVAAAAGAYSLAARCTSNDLSADPFGDSEVKCAVKRLEEAMHAYNSSRSTFLADHYQAWEELWDHSMEVVETKEESSSFSSSSISPLSKVVESSQYALFCSVRADWPYSTSPGGLPTDGYNGHTFWDMETWMLPNLILFHPTTLAYGSALEYRYNRQAGAANNAVDVVNGTQGMAFPWESAFTGYDVCPWPRGEHTEIHITADIMNAWKLYFDVTGDQSGGEQQSFFKKYLPVLNETAKFWISRATKDLNRDDGNVSWHILGVTPPDEYHFGNDSAYTNAAVKRGIQFVLDAAETLGADLGEENTAQMKDFVANVFVPFNHSFLYHPELAEGYNGGTVKQADVILLNYPLGEVAASSSSSSTIDATRIFRNDLEYYAPRTSPQGPAMTWAFYSIGYLSLLGGENDGQHSSTTSLRDYAQAAHYFAKGYQINNLPPYHQWYEIPHGSGCPNFLTGAGGFLQSIWAGLGGVRVESEALVVHPYANLTVANVTHLRLKGIQYRGGVFDFSYHLTNFSDSSGGDRSADQSAPVTLQLAVSCRTPPFTQGSTPATSNISCQNFQFAGSSFSNAGGPNSSIIMIPDVSKGPFSLKYSPPS